MAGVIGRLAIRLDGHARPMDSTLVYVAIAIVVFMVIVYFVVNTVGTRMTGAQIDQDPTVADDVEPEDRDKDFPINSDL
mgnify:CR=1 FL=1